MVCVLAMRTVSHIAIAQMCMVPEWPPLLLRNPSMIFTKVFDHLCAAQSIFAKLFCMHLVGACHYVFPSNVDSMLPTVVQSLVKPKVMMLTSFSCLSGDCLWQCLGDVHSADLPHPVATITCSVSLRSGFARCLQVSISYLILISHAIMQMVRELEMGHKRQSLTGTTSSIPAWLVDNKTTGSAHSQALKPSSRSSRAALLTQPQVNTKAGRASQGRTAGGGLLHVTCVH